ncbi:MAG: 2,3-bisphosphoglycerate-independent phosphoglycerate mutase [Candidatus Methanomethylophilaceae archaeon]
MTEKKILIIVMDGLGDRACEELRGLTPLQYIRTPNLDWFVDHGSAGLCDPIAPGIRAGSDTAHLAILGYDPYRVYTGRGPFEAIGVGMDMQPGDIALRCNFATVDDELEIIDRRASRIRAPETTELVEALDGIEIDGIECYVKESTEHRAVLLMRGDGLSADITDADPGAGTHLMLVEGRSEEGEFTADIVNRFMEECYNRLKDHPTNRKRVAAGLPPANILVPRGAGEYPMITPFPERYGMSACCVAGVGMIKGICKACGLDIYPLPPVCNGGLDSDLDMKAACALEALSEYDFVLMNCKAPDIAGHDMDAKTKAEVVKRLDSMMGYIRSNLPDDLVVAITCDHCTPCSLGDHSGEPVPIAFYAHGCVRDEAVEFSESGCSRGFIGRIHGMDIVQICLDMANRTEKFGS